MRAIARNFKFYIRLRHCSMISLVRRLPFKDLYNCSNACKHWLIHNQNRSRLQPYSDHFIDFFNFYTKCLIRKHCSVTSELSELPAELSTSSVKQKFWTISAVKAAKPLAASSTNSGSPILLHLAYHWRRFRLPSARFHNPVSPIAICRTPSA